MGMNFYANTIVSMFDRFSIVLPSSVDYFQDGPLGRRVVFLSDPEETFTISFEEGMKMLDMAADHPEEKPLVRFQCCKDGKYIHQRRVDPKYRQGIGSFAFFHIELDDDDGSTLYVPGQMVAKAGFQWTDGVEPILLDIMNGIAVCKTKGGG